MGKKSEDPDASQPTKAAEQSKTDKAKTKKKKKKTEEPCRMPWGQTLIPCLMVLGAFGYGMYQHNPCNVAQKGRKDCGFSGVSQFQCLTRGIKLPRSFDRYLPIESGLKKVLVALDETSYRVDKTHMPKEAEGLAYRASPKIDDRLKDGSYAVWDAIVTGVRVNGKGQPAKDGKWLKVSSSTKDDPHSRRLLDIAILFGKFFGPAMILWLLSGYPPGSLLWYAVVCLSAAVRFNMCCYDEDVKGGVPHCYMGAGAPF
jgi:hypothetical protein